MSLYPSFQPLEAAFLPEVSLAFQEVRSLFEVHTLPSKHLCRVLSTLSKKESVPPTRRWSRQTEILLYQERGLVVLLRVLY